MTRPELGIAFQSDKDADRYAHLARLTESLGFDVVSVYADLFYQPSLYPLLVMALNTSSVRLGPACLNPFMLHPVEIAGQIAALDNVSRGRAFLGVARGSWLQQVGMRSRRPVHALKDTLEIVSRLIQGDTGGYAGEVFSLERGARLAYDLYRPHVPVMIGTWGRRGTSTGARFAQEIKIGGSANPAMLARTRAWLMEDLPHVGRTPDAVGVVMGAVTVVAANGREARALARRAVAMYVDVIADLDPTLDLPSEMLTSMRRCLREGNVEGAGRFVSDDVLDRVAFAGTPEQVCHQVEDLLAAGARRIEFGTPHGIDETEGIRLLGERVVPHFQ